MIILLLIIISVTLFVLERKKVQEEKEQLLIAQRSIEAVATVQHNFCSGNMSRKNCVETIAHAYELHRKILAEKEKEFNRRLAEREKQIREELANNDRNEN